MELRVGISQAAIEQWGYYVESQNPTDYRYWSIPFTSHYITMATKTYYEPKEEAVPWLVGIDMQKFICGYGANFIGSSYVSCVGIGCQPQWGYLQKQAEKWIYPIPVLEAFIATKTCISNNHSAAGYVGYWTWDKDITTEYAYSWNNYPSYCFMIGKVQQQWGENVGGGGQTVSLPISFEVAFTAVVSADSSWCNASCHITTTTITTMNYQSNKPDIAQLGPVQWLAIGIQPQWGKYTNSGNDRVITYPIAFSELYYANVISSDNCETFVYGISNININYRLCNGYNDDRWNGTQTSRLFAVGR